MAFKFEDLVGPELLNSNGKEVSSSDALSGKKHVMLYFSAHWCPPCRAFTPLLAEAYEAHKTYLQSAQEGEEAIGEIEVIFISLDSVQSEYEGYRSTMPWMSVSYNNLWKMQIKDTLSKKYGVRSIPTLVVLDGETGEVVTRNGKGEYTAFFKGEYKTSSGCIVS
eukprot:g14306.t1 g14306   contig9:1574991-1575555(-)